MKDQTKGLRTWLEIDSKAVASNLKVFRSVIPKTVKLMAVVKSNAYGHGLWDFSKLLVKDGVDWLAVDSVVEALALRREGIKLPILVLGYTLPEMLEVAAKNDISVSVSNFEYFKEIKKLEGVLKIHIKVDTGMHRHGFMIEDVEEVLAELGNIKNKVKVEGLFTHFASAKNPALAIDTKKQIAIFKNWREAFETVGIKPICHACATGGALLFPEAHFDMVRIGIGLYGVWPSKETKSFLQDKLKLEPVMSWKSVIAEIKTVSKGERIGYDFTEKFEMDTKIAMVPIGYWHGYSRTLSGIGRVYVDGVSCKVLGRVCMDIIMIDVSKIAKIEIGQEVEIMGRDASKDNSADNLADLSGTSTYEFLTRINPLIKRLII
jgi:alanine racemase